MNSNLYRHNTIFSNHHYQDSHYLKMSTPIKYTRNYYHAPLSIYLVVFIILMATIQLFEVGPLQALVPPPMLHTGYQSSSLVAAALPFAEPEFLASAKALNSNKAANDLGPSKPVTIVSNHLKGSGGMKMVGGGGIGSSFKFLGGSGSSGVSGGGNGDSSSSSSNKITKEGAVYPLNENQKELIRRNPGSLLAVARALKMAIVECQYQMRHEPWDCPIYGFSIRPMDIFGKLMSRSFKETSFIHSLLSSAIAHSIARACTESMITTCGRKQTRDGGYKEDIDFGRQFAQQFMEATHESSSSSVAATTAAASVNNNNIDRNLNNNIIVPGSGAGAGDRNLLHHYTATTEPARSEKKIRDIINAHNDEVGRLHVINGMRRECKCHGLSGACNIQTCWLKLPPFREVATKLHDSLDQAMKIIYLDTNRQKSSTSAKKSNKKRSSVQPISGLSRGSSASASASTLAAASISASASAPALTYNSTVAKRRPVARSIGIIASPYIPNELDLLYREESPDFCVPSENYNIKGTKGRACSENPSASNSCERLCCGRGYKTEVREEKYKCECQFKFCCSLNCKTCSRRKVIHKCL